MTAIEVFALGVATVGFVLIFLLTILVIIGVHQEERRWTLGTSAPTASAALARRILGANYPASPQVRPSSAAEFEAGIPGDDLIADTVVRH
jgi:hypothetical protein